MCNYPNKFLSGVGIVFKFCSYIDKLLNCDISLNYTDLAAVGIIADVMDLTDFETRYIIEQGVKTIRNPFIKEICKRMDFKIQGQLNPFKIAFYIAPFINAMNRSGTFQEKILLFESMLEFKAYELIPSTKRGAKGEMETRVEQAVRTCSNVKNRQGKSRDENTELIEKLIKTNKLLDHTLIAVRLPKERAADRNLTGLIATQIANKYGHPTAILNETIHDGEVWWEGSMRGAPYIEIEDTRDMFLQSGLVEYCEGHENAGGVGIKNKNFDALMQYLDDKYADINFEPIYHIDVEIPIAKAANDVKEIGLYTNIWGKGIEEPYVAITNVKVTPDNCQMMKSNTFKITCGDLSFIKFNMPNDEYDSLVPVIGYKILTIIGTCHINDWGGYEYP